NNPKNLLTTAVSRWHIQPMHSNVENDFPGIGHPRWHVKLLKVRNGKPASWHVEWAGGFHYVSKLAIMHKPVQTQTG
ncbi:MAG: Error-prone repair protein ImuA, partial [Bacteroidota bacterium]